MSSINVSEYTENTEKYLLDAYAKIKAVVDNADIDDLDISIIKEEYTNMADIGLGLLQNLPVAFYVAAGDMLDEVLALIRFKQMYIMGRSDYYVAESNDIDSIVDFMIQRKAEYDRATELYKG